MKADNLTVTIVARDIPEVQRELKKLNRRVKALRKFALKATDTYRNYMRGDESVTAEDFDTAINHLRWVCDLTGEK